MKPAPFDLARPATLAEAVGALADGGPEARVLAGGQSLGPMLNLRVAKPKLLVQVNHLPELSGATAAPDAITLGACVTHAAIAAGRTPDLNGGVLARVAAGIAYQAVRNRGTIGGSLCHADPAADWVCALTALDAEVVLQSAAGVRRITVAAFMTGAFTTALMPGEILTALRIRRPPPNAVFGYAKACRKPGDFPHAMAAALIAGSTRRLVIGALGGKPLVLSGAQASIDGALVALADFDAVDRHMQRAVVRRALAEAVG
jgi:aerobic carbon-monoxide dehydrogenase medium subunit